MTAILSAIAVSCRWWVAWDEASRYIGRDQMEASGAVPSVSTLLLYVKRPLSSIETGLRILSLLGTDRPVLRVGEACRDLGIPKASVSRLLRNFADAGILERDSKEATYSVGARSLDLARLYLARHSLLDLAEAAVDALVERFGFTGHAGIVIGTDRVLLIARQRTFPLQHTGSIAERKPAFDSMIGRAIMARSSDEDVLAQLGFRPDEERHGGLSKPAILDELATIRRDRVAVTSNLVTPGISSAGAAFADPGRREVIGFCLSYPTSAADEALRASIIDAVYEQASVSGARLRDPFWVADKCATPAAARTNAAAQ